jgi:hypothetical protein
VSEPSRPLDLRRRLAFILAALALSALLALGAIEIFGRLFDPLGVSFYPESARYFDTLVLGGPIGYRNRPGLTGRFFHVPVSINARGMRDRAIDSQPAPGEFRVAVLGDSFPFGIGVAYEDTIPASLEAALQSKAPDGVRFRTMNFGVPSYNTEQELIQFDTVVADLHPNAVVLLFQFNDIFPKMWVLDKRRALLTNLGQRSYAVSLLFALKGLVVRRAQDPMSYPGEENYTPDDPRWLAIDRSLTAIAARCRDRGIPFAVVTFDDRERRPVAMVRAVGTREGFPVENLVPSRDPRWSSRDPRSIANSVLDSHPRPEGSRIYATLIAEELWRVGAVPARGAGSP